MTLLVCESRKCKTHKLRDSQAWQYIAFFPSCETHETHETHTDIFARSKSHFLQNSHEKNCETRLAVNPSYMWIVTVYLMLTFIINELWWPETRRRPSSPTWVPGTVYSFLSRLKDFFHLKDKKILSKKTFAFLSRISKYSLLQGFQNTKIPIRPMNKGICDLILDRLRWGNPTDCRVSAYHVSRVFNKHFYTFVQEIQNSLQIYVYKKKTCHEISRFMPWQLLHWNTEKKKKKGGTKDWLV